MEWKRCFFTHFNEKVAFFLNSVSFHQRVRKDLTVLLINLLPRMGTKNPTVSGWGWFGLDGGLFCRWCLWRIAFIFRQSQPSIRFGSHHIVAEAQRVWTFNGTSFACTPENLCETASKRLLACNIRTGSCILKYRAPIHEQLNHTKAEAFPAREPVDQP